LLSTPRQRTHRPESGHGSNRWAGAFSFEGYGAVITLRASDASVLAALPRVLPPGARPSGALSFSRAADALYSVVATPATPTRGVAPAHVLFEGSRRIAESADLDALLARLESEVHFKVALASRTRLFVHAGVVGWRGTAILVPGRTHTGKSTLVAALVRAGATYYSDEYAVLDDAGLVHPFARPLGIRDDRGRTHPVSAASLGATVAGAAAPVGLVISTRHVAGARWRPTPMSPGETVLALLENTVAARRRPADALRMLGAAVAKARALRGVRGDAARVAEQILASSPSTST